MVSKIEIQHCKLYSEFSSMKKKVIRVVIKYFLIFLRLLQPRLLPSSIPNSQSPGAQLLCYRWHILCFWAFWILKIWVPCVCVFFYRQKLFLSENILLHVFYKLQWLNLEVTFSSILNPRKKKENKQTIKQDDCSVLPVGSTHGVVGRITGVCFWEWAIVDLIIANLEKEWMWFEWHHC